MRKLILLLLFIPIVSIGQDNFLAKANKEFQGNNYDKAIIYSLKVLDKTPDNAVALSIIQLSFHFLDRFEISIEYGDRFLLLTQNKQLENKKLNTLVFYYQGLNYFFLKQKEEACSFFNLAVLVGDISVLTTKQKKSILDNCN